MSWTPAMQRIWEIAFGWAVVMRELGYDCGEYFDCCDMWNEHDEECVEQWA